MSRLISVKDHQELKKDRIVGAVINCDKDAFATFIHKKNQRKKDQEKISLLEKEEILYAMFLKSLLVVCQTTEETFYLQTKKKMNS